ncbi:MAG: crosslink repair DNA glycosylase YcaQ family protein, partial [Bryobacteraceae bacterium]
MTLRALNRTLLARQMLLARQGVPVVEAVHRLAALQTQQARLPFIALWSRLAGFQADQLRAAYRNGDVVRATWVRATLHTLTSADYRKLRWSIQPVLDAGAAAILKIRGAHIDHEAVVAEAARLFGESPRTFNDVRAVLLDRFPATDERAMGYLARMIVPLVMAPDDSEWCYP